MIYLELFWTFFQVGILSFGGGMASLPILQSQVVEQNHWMQMGQFTDLITISQMTPGPIAVNAATFVGIRMGGFGGAVVATLGCVAPACIIVSFLAWLYQKYNNLPIVQAVLGGLRPAVVALIAAAGVQILVLSIWNTQDFLSQIGHIDYTAIFIFVVSLLVLQKTKISATKVMLGAGIVGGGLYMLIDKIG